MRALERRDDLVKRLADAGVVDPSGGTDGTAARIARLKGELADLRTRFSDKYPDVIRLREEIQALERRATEIGRDGSGAPARTAPADPALLELQESFSRAQGSLKAMQAEERMLRKSIDDYQRRVEIAPQREQQLRELSRDSLATKDLYESLLKRYEDAQFAENMEQRQKGEQFRILDEAVVPQEPAGPNRRALVIAGLGLSLALVVAAVGLAEQIDTSFHAVADLRSFTRLPVLASIPRIVTDGDLRRRRRRFWTAAVPSAAGLALIVGACYALARHGGSMLWLLSIR